MTHRIPPGRVQTAAQARLRFPEQFCRACRTGQGRHPAHCPEADGDGDDE